MLRLSCVRGGMLKVFTKRPGPEKSKVCLSVSAPRNVAFIFKIKGKTGSRTGCGSKLIINNYIYINYKISSRPVDHEEFSSFMSL